MLDFSVFCQIVAVYQQPHHQLPNYFSWIAGLQATGTDAFNIPWKFKLCYLLPPFALIQKCIQKITGSDRCITYNTSLEISTMVPSFTRNADKSTSSVTSSCKIASSSNVPISSSPINEKENQSGRLSCVGKSLKERGISEKVSKILLSSWRSSTEKHY